MARVRAQEEEAARLQAEQEEEEEEEARLAAETAAQGIYAFSSFFFFFFYFFLFFFPSSLSASRLPSVYPLLGVLYCTYGCLSFYPFRLVYPLIVLSFHRQICLGSSFSWRNERYIPDGQPRDQKKEFPCTPDYLTSASEICRYVPHGNEFHPRNFYVGLCMC